MATADTEAATAALLAMAEHGVPPDIQELLIHGDGRHVKPGALSKAMRAALLVYARRRADAPSGSEEKEK